jgi:hypothetical protein
VAQRRSLTKYQTGLTSSRCEQTSVCFRFLCLRGGLRCQLANTLTQSIIGDGILVYRCWVVFSRSWLAIGVSVVLWLATTGCSVAALYFAGTLHSHDTVNAGKLQPLITSFLASSIALNVVTTGLIVYRIWRVEQSSRRMNAVSYWASVNQLNRSPAVHQPHISRLRHAMLVMVESGALYTGTAIITFITYLSGHNSSYATSDVEVQIVGIAFSMIIIRAASSAEMATTNSQNMPLSVIDRSHPVQILVSRNVEQSKADDMSGSKQFHAI